jgi:hypothetical protein
MAMEQRRLSVALAASIVLSALVPAVASAEVEIPRRNPLARVAQMVGLTAIAVDYDSPAVRGRTIWGGVVQAGEIWRTGDHPAARITFSKEVAFAGQKVAAGTYALLAIPGPAEWTLLLNRDATLPDTNHEHRADLDVARVKVRPRGAPFRERLTFLFSDFTDDRATLDLEWEKLSVSVTIDVGTREQVQSGIRALDNVWRAYAEAARYMLETKKDYDAGLVYAEKSLALHPSDETTALRAALLAAKGKGQGGGAPIAGAPAAPLTRRQAAAARRAAALAARQQARQQAQPAQSAKVAIDDPPMPGSAPGTEPPPVPTMAVMVPEGARPGPGAPAAAGAGAGAAATTPAATTPPATDPKPIPPSVDPPTFQPSSAATAGMSERPERRAPVHVPAASRPTAPPPTTMPEPAEIAPIIQRGRADIQSCYQRALRHDPTLVSGKITISIGIGSSGAVKSVALDAPRPLRALEPCIKDAVSRWAFPLSPSEYGTELPIVLQGKE